LFSFLNPAHEAMIRDALRLAFPDMYLSISSEVQPEFREYERLSTTVLNAYLQPVIDRYLGDFAAGVGQVAPQAALGINQSAGGLMSVARARHVPIRTALSGPAAGAVGAIHMAKLSGVPDVISLDMGGTSADVALMRGYTAGTTFNKWIEGYPARLASLDINAVGAGGGSIAWFDRDGLMKVGPQRAGAQPGPACYGKGGTRATVTDANLVLGFLDPANFLGGRIALDTRAARTAVDAVARDLGTTALRAAEGISRVVNTNMAEGIKIVSVRRGVDPRRFALVSFGGAAGLHVTEVARLLEIHRVVVPSVAAVLSAWGMLATDLRYELVRSHVSEVGRMTAAGLRKLFATLEREGRKRLARFDGPVTVRRALDMRYGEQIFEIQVDLDGVDLQAGDLLDQAAERFHRRHEELYAYSAPGQEVVIVNARVAVVGALPVLPAGAGAIGRSAAASSARRRVWLGDWVEVPLYRMETLAAGLEVKGPAIFESATTTVLVRESERVTVTPHGWLDIRLG
jgi:N-methylhydantoinase A